MRRKGISVSVFILGLAMTCASVAVMALGAVAMGDPRPRRGRFAGKGRPGDREAPDGRI